MGGRSRFRAGRSGRIALLDPDIVIIDVRLGNDDGIALAAKLHADGNGRKTIIFSAYSGDEELFRALEVGTRGYILKEFAATEIVLAIDHVRRGLRYISPCVAHRLVANGPRVHLTPRELEVLKCVARGQKNKDIGKNLSISPATVRTYVENLLSKFGCHDRTALVGVAISRGFLAAGDFSSVPGADDQRPG